MPMLELKPALQMFTTKEGSWISATGRFSVEIYGMGEQGSLLPALPLEGLSLNERFRAFY